MKLKSLPLILLTTIWLTPFLYSQNQKSKKPAPLWKKGIYHESVPEPTFKAVQYGKHRRNVLDFWQATSDKATPVVISIHGGGWNGGDKSQLDSFVNPNELLEAGISVAAINYRLIKHSKDLSPPVQGPMSDAARAVQFIRSMAKEWNLDKTQFAAVGGSAGACTSLWLAYHDDLADPTSKDPIARESTRLCCVAAIRAQTTLDPKLMKSWIPNSKYGAHAFGKTSFEEFLSDRDELLPQINQFSPYSLLDKQDPSTYLFYTLAPTNGKKERDPTHSAAFGVGLLKACKELGIPCELVHPDSQRVKNKTPTAYLLKTLKPN